MAAVLVLVKEVTLDNPITNSLLISGGRVQSESIGSSFLLPFVETATGNQKTGPIPLPAEAIIASKIAIPGLKEAESYLLCGIDERLFFTQNRKVISYGMIVSLLILLCLSGYAFYLSRRLTKPLLAYCQGGEQHQHRSGKFWMVAGTKG